MDTSILTLRQRKLLHHLRTKDSYITGTELAGYLHVTTRTIRNDVQEINHFLQPYGIQISSKHSCGYLLEAEDKELLNEVNKVSSSFLSRDERVRHIAFRLCLSDIPVNLYDLEDEMFISHTTLEQDLKALRKDYILPYPHIEFFRHRNTIYFEQDERKRRAILNHLFTENWNYNDRGNTFYHYQYLEESVVNMIIQEVNTYLARHHIIMDDINVVYLNLAIAIMYYRIRDGHGLTVPTSAFFLDSLAVHCADSLLDCLEEKLDCVFLQAEREEIYHHISCSRLLDADLLNYNTVQNYFSDELLFLADAYLDSVRNRFHLDLANDEDFYITLLQYLRYLTFPARHFNNVQDNDISSAKYLVEFEIAFSFQPLAVEYYGNYLNKQEILYLTYCIAGALESLNRTAPKLKTILLCHLNLTATWNLKQQILSKYTDYIDITGLLPMYIKDSFDFSDTDLVITTTSKEIANAPGGECLSVSPFFTAQDRQTLEAAILKAQTNRLYQQSLPSIKELLQDAFWHENIDAADYFAVIELLAADFLDYAYATPDFITDILRRESIFSFAFQSGVVLLYSMKPATKSCLSIATLNHRIKWNNHKIRGIILASFKQEESTLVFRLINEFFYTGFASEHGQKLKTKEEYLDFFR